MAQEDEEEIDEPPMLITTNDALCAADLLHRYLMSVNHLEFLQLLGEIETLIEGQVEN